MAKDFKTLFDTTRSALALAPEAAKATFEVESRQADGLRSTVNVRGFTLDVDEPEALGGTDAAPNPVEYVLAALASCQEITYRLYADTLGIPLDNVSVRLKGTIDLRGFFGVDPAIRAGYQAIEATVTLDSPASREDLERLTAEVDRHCPVLDILANQTPVTLAVAFANTRGLAA